MSESVLLTAPAVEHVVFPSSRLHNIVDVFQLERVII